MAENTNNSDLGAGSNPLPRAAGANNNNNNNDNAAPKDRRGPDDNYGPDNNIPDKSNGNNNNNGGNGNSSSNNKHSGNKNSSSSGLSSTTKVSIIVGIVGVVIVLILLCIICVMCARRKKRKKMDPRSVHPYGWQGGPNQPHKGNQQWQPSPNDHPINMPPSGGWESGPYSSGSNMQSSSSDPPPNLQLGFNKSTFTYEELAAATKGFDQANMLGQGGFGYVHKGVLPNGKQIAVKSLKSGSGQGDREFHAEVEIISRVHHKHLVSLVGYCIAQSQRMLVYEFVPNDTLEHHLHKKKNPPLDFSARLRIALGSAKGLSYLHEDCHPRIIHRDIKASNILLEDNFEAMVADFGLAKLTNDTNTHVSTRVMGTFGYLAPEYAASGKLTEKSDVFSFGVMLLELITGRRPVDPDMKYMEDSLVDWSRPLLVKALETGNYNELVDPQLEGNYNPQEMQRMVACAAASIRHSSKKRPKMSQIVRVLEGDVSLEDLNDSIAKQGQHMAFNSPDTSGDYDSRQYSMDLKKFRQMALDTQDFASSEYGGTRDYGTNSSMSSGPNMR